MAKKKSHTKPSPTLRRVCSVLEEIAPARLAQSWDNVGLLAGDLDQPVRRMLLCIDLMPLVVEEALGRRMDLIVAYHPPIFKPVSRLTAPSPDSSSAVFRCIAAGTAIYSPHTALDAAAGGTNDVLGELCGAVDLKPLEHGLSDSHWCKLVAFVAPSQVEAVVPALLAAAGEGQVRRAGSAAGGERLELSCRAACLPAVVEALTTAGTGAAPAAYDIYPLKQLERLGIGRVGQLQKPQPLGAFARRLKRLTGAGNVAIVGDAGQRIARVIVAVGAAGSLPFSLPQLGAADVIVTGEIRHHDALRILRTGCAAVALSHWSSERPALAALCARLQAGLADVAVQIHLSEQDREPFVRI